MMSRPHDTRGLRGLLAAATLCLMAAGPAQAGLVNGDFSQGDTGWQTLGLAEFPGGTARLSNADGALESGALAAQLGLASAEVFDTAAAQAYEGSALQQQFSSAAGERLSFRWSFGTDETSAEASFADYAFLLLDGQLIRLGGVGDGAGWQSASFQLAAGQHTLAFGVLDLGDYVTDSTLSLAAVSVSAVPEPAPLPLALAGLGTLWWLRRRRA